MLGKQKPKVTKVHLVVVVLLGFHVAQTKASPLKNSATEDGQKETTDTASDLRQGLIVFGKGPKNNSVKADAAYQADFSGRKKV